MAVRIVVSAGLMGILVTAQAFAAAPWNLSLIATSQGLSPERICHMASIDLDGNGRKELVVTDIGQCHGQGKKTGVYSLRVLEWDGKSVNVRWHKEWKEAGSFKAWRMTRLLAWAVDKHPVIEAIPPYFSLRWSDANYHASEQTGFDIDQRPKVGSWALPWLSAACYGGGYRGKESLKTGPRECLLGVRDISMDGQAELVTLWEQENAFYQADARRVLRVRKLAPGFPVEWESVANVRFDRVLRDVTDALNTEAVGPLPVSGGAGYWVLETEGPRGGYQLRPSRASWTEGLGLGMSTSEDLPYRVRVGSTQQRRNLEYWGYRAEELQKPREDMRALLRKVTIKADFSGFTQTDIDFPYHKRFLGIGSFELADLDGDSLDEVIVVERTGQAEFMTDGVNYHQVKDYIHILKWDGKTYQTVWISKPVTTEGTTILVEDLTNSGRKQLVVADGSGAIQIWDRR
ncbi:MAG: hypothetical protein ACOYXU_02570 [Nitrospirota bacterium]